MFVTQRSLRAGWTAALLLAASASNSRAATRVTPVWSHATGVEPSLSIVEDVRGRPFLYVAQKSGGLLVLGLRDGQPPSPVFTVATSALGGLDAMWISQTGNRLFVALGSFFAAQGSKTGLGILDVTDPAKPRVLSRWISSDKRRGASSVLVRDGLAFLAAMDRGVLIFDVRKPRRPVLVSETALDPHFPKPNPSGPQTPNARGLALSAHLLYVAHDAGGLRVLDVADPVHPIEVGHYINPAVGPKQQAYNHLVVDGTRAYVSVDYCGLEVLDLSDAPREIRQIAWWNPWRCETVSNTWFNSPGHTNQLALDAKRRRLYLSAGDSDLRVLDVRDPAHPTLVANSGGLEDHRGAWGVALGKQEVYLALIRALIPFRGDWSGVQAFARLP